MAEPERMPEPEEPRLYEAPEPQRERPYSGLSIASLILGLFGTGFFFIPGFGVLSSTLAVIFGLIGLSQVNRGIRRGAGMAIAGLVLGLIGLLGFVFALAALF